MFIEEIHCQSYVHESYLYYKVDKKDDVILILWQFDKFLVANKDPEECDWIRKLTQSKMTTFSLNTLGLVQKFNSVNIE